MFAKDRDLVVLEPGLMRDVAWAGQRVLYVNSSVSGTTMTLVSGSFLDSGVEAGHVAVFNNTALEVVSVESATSATVSLMRASTGGNVVPGPQAHLMFADVSRIRVKMRIVQEFEGADLDSPIPGAMGELRMYVSSGSDAREKLVVTDAVVESVVYSAGGSTSQRTITLVCVSSDGILDPLALSTPV